MNIGLREPIRFDEALSNSLDKTTGNIFNKLNYQLFPMCQNHRDNLGHRKEFERSIKITNILLFTYILLKTIKHRKTHM